MTRCEVKHINTLILSIYTFHNARQASIHLKMLKMGWEAYTETHHITWRPTFVFQ